MTWHRDDKGKRISPPANVEAFPPDFKVRVTLRLYVTAVRLFIAGIELHSGGDWNTVMQHWGSDLQRHLAQTAARPGWNKLTDPPETLVENIKKRIVCMHQVSSEYAERGVCYFNIVCDNTMERTSTYVRTVAVRVSDDVTATTLCNPDPALGSMGAADVLFNYLYSGGGEQSPIQVSGHVGSGQLTVPVLVEAGNLYALGVHLRSWYLIDLVPANQLVSIPDPHTQSFKAWTYMTADVPNIWVHGLGE